MRVGDAVKILMTSNYPSGNDLIKPELNGKIVTLMKPSSHSSGWDFRANFGECNKWNYLQYLKSQLAYFLLVE